MPDALKVYKSKRDFSITSEPAEGGEPGKAGRLSFVIQKHWASRLHYDGRLELDGTMKSWAVPKKAPARAAKAARPGKPGKAGAMPEGAVKAALPAEFAPELATLVDTAPANAAEWVFEIKFDGYRMLARIEGKDVRLVTRNG